MIRQVSLRILMNALLLLVLAFLLIFLQFRNRALSFRLGDFNIILYQMTQNKETFLSHAKLEGRSLELDFGSASSGLKEGLFEKPLALKDYSAGRDTFTLFFEDNISVSFFLDQDKFLIISANNLPSEAASIRTPLTLAPRASWISADTTGIAQLNYQKQDLEVSLNTPSSYEELKRNRLYLSGQPIKIGPFLQLAQTEPETPPAPISPPAPVEAKNTLADFNFKVITSADLTKEQETFRAKAYNGLVNRYNRNTSTWTRGNSSEFSEKAMIATLAESLMRGTYLTQSALMTQANIRFPSRTTVESALYLGDVVNKHSRTREQKQEEIANLSRESALAMTIRENMANDLFLYGTVSEFDRIVTLWENTNLLEQSWNLDQISHFVANYARTRYLLGKSSSDSFLNTLEDLFNQFGVRRENRFILADNDKDKIEASLRLANATLILTEGQAGFTELRDKARTLLVGTLRLADANGNFTGGDTIVYPEDVYSFVSASRYLPKVTLLSRANRSWALFASDILSTNITQTAFNFKLNFFTEMPEHAVFSRIPYPQLVNFRGITWRTDPQFQIYTDGWTYLTRTQSLYLKISHLMGATIDLSVNLGTGESTGQ